MKSLLGTHIRGLCSLSTDATPGTNLGEDYFTLIVQNGTLRFEVITDSLSLNHDCGVFEERPDFLYMLYTLNCADGNSTIIEVLTSMS